MGKAELTRWELRPVYNARLIVNSITGSHNFRASDASRRGLLRLTLQGIEIDAFGAIHCRKIMAIEWLLPFETHLRHAAEDNQRAVQARGHRSPQSFMLSSR